jgi:hypothetical protein
MAKGDHPRRPKGLPKTGGRRAGSVNKQTVVRQRGFVAAGASPEMAAKPPGQLPLSFMLDLMNDTNQSLELRLVAARYAAPYVHSTKGHVDVSGISQPLVVQILRFSPEASEPAMVIEHDSNGGQP